MLPYEVTPLEVKARMDAGEELCLIDVREIAEFNTAKIETANLVPMDTVPQNLQMLEGQADQTPLIVFCHHGMRSLQVVNWLRKQGLDHCQSMAGGIDRWSIEVDPTVPRY